VARVIILRKFVWRSGGNRGEDASGSLLPGSLPNEGIYYFFFLVVFSVSGLTFFFDVFFGEPFPSHR
jgi:hypothetical protein